MKTEITDSKPNTLTAIIVDDEPANRDFLVRLIQQAKYTTQGAGSGQEALKLAAQLPYPPTVVIIDIELPDLKGEELVKQFRELYPATRLIMATMHDDQSIINNAFANGCNAFLVKPHGFMELFKRLQQAPESLEQVIFDKYGMRPYRRS